MIENKYNFDFVLFQLLNAPSFEVSFQLERLFKDCSATAKKVTELVLEHPEVRHLINFNFEGIQEPDGRHKQLFLLCPKIRQIGLFACHLSRQDFKQIVKFHTKM